MHTVSIPTFWPMRYGNQSKSAMFEPVFWIDIFRVDMRHSIEVALIMIRTFRN